MSFFNDLSRIPAIRTPFLNCIWACMTSVRLCLGLLSTLPAFMRLSLSNSTKTYLVGQPNSALRAP